MTLKKVTTVVLLLLCAAASGRENPAAAGLSIERLERLDAVIERSIAAGNLSGAVVLIHRNGQLAKLTAYGLADVDTGRPMRTDDVFRIASMTKAITATAVLMLYEQGHLLLDDPVGEYLPSFDKTFDVVRPDADGDGYVLEPARRPVTIRHLLTHTSGLSYRFMGLEPLTTLYGEAGLGDGFDGDATPLADFVPKLAAMPLAHQPGERFTYGLGPDVLGRLVEVVSGMPFDAFLARHIFEPLGMHDTYFEVPRPVVSRMPAVHRRADDGGLEVVPAGPIDDGPTRFSVDYPYDGVTVYSSGGAGLSATAEDYARFLRMILNNGRLDGTRILGRKTIELMSSDQLGHIEDPGYGAGGATLGFSLGAGPESGDIRSAGSLGFGGFFNTMMWVDPSENLIAVLMTQHYPYGIDLLGRFPVAVYQAIDD